MTNQKAAIIRGMERFSHTKDEYKRAIIGSGLTVVGENVGICGMTGYEAKAWTQRGWLHIFCGENGTARIDKPNGTHKWVYEKTPNQIGALLRQTMEFYK